VYWLVRDIITVLYELTHDPIARN